MKPSSIKQQSGATLIEILVAVLVLNLGLLGMAALQTRALQGSHSANQRSQAVMLAQYMLDAMRIDRERAKGGDYSTGGNFVCGADAYTGTTLPYVNRRDWLTSLQNNLSHSSDTGICGAIACDANYNCSVSIRWDDSKAGGLGEQVIRLDSKL